MDVGVYAYSRGDPLLIDRIVNEFLSQGKFDKLRKECMSDADTKPAYQNLQQRVENTVTQFLKKQVWRPDLNKNQLRDTLRKHILESGFFDAGINRIVDQVVNPNVLATVFMPEVEEVVYNYLSIPRPTERNQKKGLLNNGDEKIKASNNEHEIKDEKDTKEKMDTYESQPMEQTEAHKTKDLVDKVPKDKHFTSIRAQESTKSQTPPLEDKIKVEPEEAIKEEGRFFEKMEIPSDESQESVGRAGVESLRINEAEAPLPDSDDSVPLEINEKSMSESGDSEDSIMNQMSPISQGRLTPDILEEVKPEMELKEEKQIVEKVEVREIEEKRPSEFIGRIPKIKREDSESSKSSKPEVVKKEKFEVKQVFSSDESDSNKSYGKSDSDEKKLREKKKSETPSKDEKKRDDSEKRRKHDDHHKSSKNRSHDRSKDRKDKRRDRSRDRHDSKKSSRDRSSSRHKSRHKDSKSRDHDKKKKEEEKKKSKSTDDHSKERNKKEDRRSTDRDSNERDRERGSGSRSQGESRKREREQKSTESHGEKQREEEQVEEEVEIEPEMGEMVIEMKEDWVAQEEIILVAENVVAQDVPEISFALDFGDLYQSGALTKLDFPTLTDDFYVKFNSTGFKYFEEWEKTKLDCEEEFKEFVDEAESNLTLISDDESDFDICNEFNFDEENRRTIANLLKGVGNFRKSAMFDPKTSEFYRWTNQKFYQKFRRKCEGRERRSTEKESDDSTKENIDRSRNFSDGEKENQKRDNKALHLKLLNKYKRRAMRPKKHRRRFRKGKDSSGGIKEKNDNHSPGKIIKNYRPEIYKAVTETENWKLSNSISISNKRDAIERSGCNITETKLVGNTETVENNLVKKNNSAKIGETIDEIVQENRETKLDVSQTESLTKLPQNLPLNLPPSPDSDVNANNNSVAGKKRIFKPEDGTPKRQKRNYSQKYDSQDLYKPRPILNTSRSRGRADKDIISISGDFERGGI